MDCQDTLSLIIPPDRVGRLVSLAPFTTFGVGGPADWLVEVRNAAELLSVLRVAWRTDVPVTLLGGGSNVLIADTGIRGLVIRVRGGSIDQIDSGLVAADAGVSINGLVRWTIARGLAGLERWAGTPGTVGGAVFGNAHFQGQLIGASVEWARVASRDGLVREVEGLALEFGYDWSRLQRTGEVLLTAGFRVHAGDPVVLREHARQSLAFRKRTQPLALPSAGCIFKNPDPAHHRLPQGIPASAGALIDQAGLKGRSIGGAQVSTVHANFIVNRAGATAADIRALIELCKREVAARFGVTLQEEVMLLGTFEDK